MIRNYSKISNLISAVKSKLPTSLGNKTKNTMTYFMTDGTV